MSIDSILETLLASRISRKRFIKLCLAGLGTLFMSSVFPRRALGEDFSMGRKPRKISAAKDLVVAKGEDPYLMTVKSIEAMGGMDRFVRKNDVVLIKPNMAWDRVPEQAGTTNPEVIEALVELSFKAGARRVNVFDRTCNDARRCYENSQIAESARKKGANVYFVDDWNFVKAHFPYDSPMEGWPIYRDAIECDTFINVPILKHHGLTGLTLSMKNLMGICGGQRGNIHNNIGVKLAHLTDFIKPDLTIIDAYRVLVRNGPSGGDLKDVEYYKTLIVGIDPTLADSYASGLLGKDPLSINYIDESRKNNFGNFDVSKADILELKV